MADALISPVVGGTMWAASAGLTGHCSKKVSDDLDDARITLVSLLPLSGKTVPVNPRFYCIETLICCRPRELWGSATSRGQNKT
jgi:hypothetical protein